MAGADAGGCTGLRRTETRRGSCRSQEQPPQHSLPSPLCGGASDAG